MRSIARRAFGGAIRTYRTVAFASIPTSPSSAARTSTCDRNVRVGANSPSLCPTIASVMYTGTCLRPSWTAIVCPTISGTIVERRDQVRMTCFSPRRFISTILIMQVVVRRTDPS
ncbi:MAG: hypothetical protein KatS3mg014_1723 [Actinomycetota bacterium]|nr:MAG: hypothetical protein KatS3mg014_1723 [Actinomycetota bacterium]